MCHNIRVCHNTRVNIFFGTGHRYDTVLSTVREHSKQIKWSVILLWNILANTHPSSAATRKLLITAAREEAGDVWRDPISISICPFWKLPHFLMRLLGLYSFNHLLLSLHLNEPKTRIGQILKMSLCVIRTRVPPSNPYFGSILERSVYFWWGD